MPGRPKPLIYPRVLNHAQTAAYLGRSTTWLSDHMDGLAGNGFPAKLALVDGWDKHAIDAWLDRIGGLGADDPDAYDDALMAAAHG